MNIEAVNFINFIVSFPPFSQLCDVTISSIGTPSEVLFGQNPHWDVETNSLYFVDLFGKLLIRYSYTNQKLDWLKVDGIETPGYFMPIQCSFDRYAVGANDTAYIMMFLALADAKLVLFRTFFSHKSWLAYLISTLINHYIVPLRINDINCIDGT